MSRWRVHILTVAAAVLYIILDLTLATGFVVGVTAGMMLNDEVRERAQERYARQRPS